jgi:hypothetical protein
MLKDKIERLESQGKKSNFTGSWGTVELEVEIADSGKAVNQRRQR